MQMSCWLCARQCSNYQVFALYTAFLFIYLFFIIIETFFFTYKKTCKRTIMSPIYRVQQLTTTGNEDQLIAEEPVQFLHIT